MIELVLENDDANKALATEFMLKSHSVENINTNNSIC